MKEIYRYEIDYKSDDNETGVRLKKYQVIRETEHNYFINHLYQHGVSKPTKRVSRTARNTFAYNTIEKARKHFIRRTEKRLSWYKYWIKECEKGLEIIKELKVLEREL